jgi:purine catabolism regulator
VTFESSNSVKTIMTVTLDWLLSVPELDLRLLVGRGGLLRGIRWVHPIELEDPAPWLRGGELILTTGLHLPRTTDGQRQYVDRLASAGVAALGFGVGLKYGCVPRSLFSQCEIRGLPLLEVPRPTPFIAIVQTVAERLSQQESMALQRTVKQQHLMTEAALVSGVAGVVGHLARALHGRVVVVDAHLAPLATSAADTDDVVTRVRLEFAGQRDPCARLSISIDDGQGCLVVQSLGVGPVLRGLLGVATTEPLNAADRMLLSQAAVLLALELERPQVVLDAQRELASTMLQLLLDVDVASEAAARPLRHLGFGLRDDVCVLLVTGSGPRLPLEQQTGAALEALGCAFLLTGRDEGTAVLVPSNDVDRAIDALLSMFRDEHQYNAVIGVSAQVAPQHVAYGFRGACHAARRAKFERLRVARFDNETLHMLFADATVRESIRSLTEPILRRVISAHKTSSSDLLASAEAFVRYNGSWEIASRAVGVHRHTLHHRMQKVEELTELNFDSAEDRAALLLAFLARDAGDLMGTIPTPTIDTHPRNSE